MHIRFATADDADSLLGMIRELASFEKLELEVVATADGLRQNLFGARPVAEAVIAEVDGKPAGFALYFHNFSTFLGKAGIYLEDLYVQPAHRGSGIGIALLQHLAQIATERDCGRMEWSVLDWNQKAIDLYLKLGAKPMDDWTVYRLDQVSIQKLAGSPSRFLNPQ